MGHPGAWPLPRALLAVSPLCWGSHCDKCRVVGVCPGSPALGSLSPVHTLDTGATP